MIHKIITSWIKEGDDSSFTSAWTTIINALAGAWGDINYKPIDNQDISVNVSVSKSYFQGQLFLNGNLAAGSYVFKSPYSVEDTFKLSVEDITSGEVQSSVVYVINQSGGAVPSVTINVSGGEQLITFTGKARRI